ncbi:MAG: hypothetical protein UU31_C0010G0017, partial [Candidatus Uhrbacteria bacterium GW2011_GWA2_41_10]
VQGGIALVNGLPGLTNTAALAALAGLTRGATDINTLRAAYGTDMAKFLKAAIKLQSLDSVAIVQGLGNLQALLASLATGAPNDPILEALGLLGIPTAAGFDLDAVLSQMINNSADLGEFLDRLTALQGFTTEKFTAVVGVLNQIAQQINLADISLPQRNELIHKFAVMVGVDDATAGAMLAGGTGNISQVTLVREDIRSKISSTRFSQVRIRRPRLLRNRRCRQSSRRPPSRCSANQPPPPRPRLKNRGRSVDSEASCTIWCMAYGDPSFSRCT